nr:nitrate regulatory gene2 protein [Ipomoea batatas]
MGCCYSRVEREELVSRCKARKSYMKQFVKARHAFSAAHTMYIRSLRNTGSALFQFATAETNLRRIPPPQNPLRPPLPSTPPPLSPTPTTVTWTTSTTTSSAVRPPPPPPHGSSWDFWDPFVPASSRSVTEEEWEETTVASEVAVTTTTTAGEASVAPPPSVVSQYSKDTTATTSDLAVVVSTKSKDLVEIIKELDEYFLKAANAGAQLSLLLEVPTGTISDQRSSVERLYAWEKKLYLEVRNAETLKLEHEKKVAHLRKLEMKRADYVKTEKAKKEVEKLESQMMVASQAIETISAEIVKLRESELYPQLVNLVKGLMYMWRSMYESHQVQTHIVQQLKYLSAILPTDPTSEIHRQSTLQLELEVQQWHLSFCNLVKAQRDYIQSLTGWLRLSMFQLSNKLVQKTGQDSSVYSFCEEWHLAVNNAPDKVASEGIKSFLSVINAIVVQQTDELKQKKRLDLSVKELEKKANELRSMESKYGPYSMSDTSRSTSGKNPVGLRRVKVDTLRARAEDEKAKYDKLVGVTRAMTLSNLQMGLPHVFQAVTGFANVCTHAFESVYNQAKSSGGLNEVKRISL